MVSLTSEVQQFTQRAVAGMEGSMAYKQLSSIRSAQRKANQKDKHAPLEQEELAVRKKQALKKEEAFTEMEKQTSEKKKEEFVGKKEEFVELEKQTPKKKEEDNKEDCIETYHAENASKVKDLAENASKVKEQLTVLIEGLKVQEELFKVIESHQAEIATKGYLDNFEARITGNLNTVAKEVASGVASVVGKILTSRRRSSASTQRERIMRSSATRAAHVVATVTGGSTKQQISVSIVNRYYEEAITLALDADEPTLGWTLYQLKDHMNSHPGDENKILSLLGRLVPLVTAEGGVHIGVFTLWFEAMLEKAVLKDLVITAEVHAAEEHIRARHVREQARLAAAIEGDIEKYFEQFGYGD
ncbi:Uncharacterized protein Rs2_18066 [Raphanus sativus]|nr:Uncharacterized protein Rs2_18066 [Raphanus sativus]